MDSSCAATHGATVFEVQRRQYLALALVEETPRSSSRADVLVFMVTGPGVSSLGRSLAGTWSRVSVVRTSGLY